jgi:hypothetical protein
VAAHPPPRHHAHRPPAGGEVMSRLYLPPGEPPVSKGQHPLAPEMGDDEEYVDYLNRLVDFYTQTPPPAPEGFELIECEATPRHWPEYRPVDDNFYDGPCSACQYQSLAEAHSGCEHSHHRAWRRWKITRRIVGRLYTFGIIANGGTWHSGGGCEGCVTGPFHWRGRRVYILGLQREHWRCLFRGHRYRQYLYGGLCTVCAPCPECGSTDADHPGACEATS